MSEDFRTQPHDQAAEAVVLGTMLTHDRAAAEGVQLLSAEDFYVPRHALVFAAIHAQLDQGLPTDAIAVSGRTLTEGTAMRCGGATGLFELVQAALPPSSLAYYAGIVAGMAKRRALLVAATRVVQRAYDPAGGDTDDLAQQAVEDIRAVADRGIELGDTSLSLDDLLATPVGYDWLVPGLLERGDRLIVTGGEGTGKSVLVRQFAVATAAGLHPFTQEPIPTKRVLVVDCENSAALNQRHYGPLRAAAARSGWPVTASTLRLEVHPEGVNLATPAGARWLLSRVERHEPDLLVIGPLYRLHAGDPSDERDARRIATVLDRAREVCGSALVLEAHSPHLGMSKSRALRPVGSSLWMRWPEFGYGLRASAEEVDRRFGVHSLEAWRGPRDERQWPKRLRRGRDGWPWIDDREGSADFGRKW